VGQKLGGAEWSVEQAWQKMMEQSVEWEVVERAAQITKLGLLFCHSHSAHML